MDTATSNLLNISDAARKLGVTEKTLRNWEHQGKVQSIRTHGGHRRYSLDDLKLAKSVKYKHVSPMPEMRVDIKPKDGFSKKKFVGRTFLLAGMLALGLTGVKGAGEYRKALGKSWMASGYDGSGVVLAESISLGNTAFNVRVPTNVSESLTVDGVVTIGSGLGVTGDTSMDGSLTVTGTVTVGDLGTGIVTATGGLLTLSTGIDGALLNAGSIVEAGLSSTNDATDNYVLSFDLATGGFTWVAQTTDTDTDTNYWTDSGSFVYLTTTTDKLRLGSSSTPSALLHVGSGGTPTYIDGTDDVYIYDDLEVDGTIYGNISGSITSSLTQGSVVFAGSGGVLSENNSAFYWDDTNERLGIGTTAPGEDKLLILSSINGSEGSNPGGLSVSQNINVLSDVSRTVEGLSVSQVSSSTFNSPNTTLQGAGVGTLHNGTGAIGNMLGINNAAVMQAGSSPTMYGLYNFSAIVGSNGAVTVTNIYGIQNEAVALGVSGNNSTVTNIYGIKNRVENGIFISGAASLDTAYGIFSEVGSQYLIGGTATITNAYNLYLNNFDLDNGYTAATITNNYGLYIETPTRGSTLNYSIYSQGGTNYFGGNVGIGVTAPQGKLQINGNSDVSQLILRRYSAQTAAVPSFKIEDSSGTTLLELNTNANKDVYLGYQAGYSTTSSATNNVFIGYEAGRSNTYGNSNVFIGYQAGRSNPWGLYNVFLGFQAGYSNDLGNYNTFIGQQAGLSNTSGEHNTFMGEKTGYYNQTGSNNSVIGDRAAGYSAGSVYSFSNSVMFGYRAGVANRTGSNNVFLGVQTAETNTTGSNNIVLGYDIDLPSATVSNMLNIGNLIYADGLDGTGTTLSTGNVGIGVTAPTANLHIYQASPTADQELFKIGTSDDSDRFYIDEDGQIKTSSQFSDSTMIGLASNPILNLSNSDTTDNNYAAIAFSSYFERTGVSNFNGVPAAGIGAQFLDHVSATSYDFPVDLYFWTGYSPIGAIFGTPPAEALRIKASGSVGVGTSVPGAKLSVVGGVGIGTTDSFANAAIAANTLAVQGKVGIGVTSPGYSSLAVVGGGYGLVSRNAVTISDSVKADLRLDDTGDATSLGYAIVQDGEGLLFTHVPTGGGQNDFLYFSYADLYTNLTTDFLLDGNLGVGTTGPGTNLSVAGGVGIGTTDSFASAAIAANNLAVQGSVGIGVTAPQAGLHVGTGGTPSYTGANDVYVQNDIEVDGWVYADGGIDTGGTSFLSTTTLYSDNTLRLLSGTGQFLMSGYSGTGNAASITSSSTGSANKALNIAQSGATSGTDYGIYVANTGAATTNVAGYFSASGATNNYAGIFENGKVGIGTTSPTTALHVVVGSGDIATFDNGAGSGCTLSDGGVISCSSDANLKKNVEGVESGLERVLALNPVLYNWNTQNDGEDKQAGFIAQEVETVFPDLVRTNLSGYKTLSMLGMVPYLTGAIQELSQEIEDLRQAQSGVMVDTEVDLGAVQTDVTAENITTTDLTVLGETLLAETTIVGGLNIGLIQIDPVENSIDAVGTLKLQSLALGDIEFEGGLVRIDTEGNIVAESVEAKKFVVAGASAGVAAIEAGETSVQVLTDAVNEDSLIFVTSNSPTRQPLNVTEKTAGEGFTVEIIDAETEDIEFNWWIVERTSEELN